MSGISTHAQRLQWQHEERTDGYELEPCLAEQLEIADEEFRHFDQMTFAPAPPLRRLGGNTGANGAAVHSSGSSGGSPEPLTRPTDTAGLGAAVVPPGGRSALPFEHWLWAA